jgi:hypothetical protein
MKSTNVFSLTVLLLLAAGSVYAGSGFDSVADKAKKANEAVRSVNDLIRDVDQTVEGVGGAKEGVKEIGRDTTDVLGIDAAPPTRQSQQTQQAQQSATQTQTQQQPRQTTTITAPIVTPAGKAWVIKDNNIQGSGRAYIFRSDGRYEYYNRIYGIWVPVPRRFYTYSVTEAATRQIGDYSMTIPPSLIIDIPGDSASDRHDEYEYNISGNGTTLEISGGWGGNNADGRYTLMDFSGPEKPGGSGGVVVPAGMGWFYNSRQMIFNSSGIYAAYGAWGPWVAIGHEGTYSLNQSAGTITINEHVPPQPGRDTVYNYSITDFSGGNKTLRIWGENPNGYEDDVYKLEAYPSGTKLPRTK